jgi:hypothetical protein
MKPDRIKWPLVLDRAVEIINEYDTSVTLRQLFYRLVSAAARLKGARTGTVPPRPSSV